MRFSTTSTAARNAKLNETMVTSFPDLYLKIELSGDRAASTTYGVLVHAQEKLDGAMSVVTQHGVYVDAWLRTAAGWRSQSRRLDNLFIVGRFLGPNEVKAFAKPLPY